jgi:GAF domain-containing protein
MHAIETLHRASRDLLFVDDQKQLAGHVVTLFDTHLHARGTAVYLRDQASFQLVASSLDGASGSADANDPAILRLRSSGETVIVHDVQSSLRGTYALPISTGSRLCGVCVLDCGTEAPLDREELEAARSVAHSAAVAVENIRLRRQRRQIAELRAELRALRSQSGMASTGDTATGAAAEQPDTQGEPAA